MGSGDIFFFLAYARNSSAVKTIPLRALTSKCLSSAAATLSAGDILRMPERVDGVLKI